MSKHGLKNIVRFTREPIRGWIKGGYSSKEQGISLPPPGKLGGFLLTGYRIELNI